MKNIAIVCHDAGGAEILSSWLNFNKNNYKVVLAGPAIKIFKQKCPKISFHDMASAIKTSDLILCGSGWQSDFEIKAIKLAKKLGKKTIVFLDHWTNYKERFLRSNKLILPDEIWVGDRYAELLAKRDFPTTSIFKKNNPYFEEKIVEINTRNKQILETNNTLLYLCEPISDHALKQFNDINFFGYSEIDAMNFLFKNLHKISKKIDHIIIRPHPSENLNKYKWVTHSSPVPVKFSKNETLITDILKSKFVVGCDSMAMVIAIFAKKQVISTIPPGGKSLNLPQKEIRILAEMIEENNC